MQLLIVRVLLGVHTHLGELLLQLLPLLVVGLSQVLPLPDQHTQLAQGPRVQIFRVLPQHAAQVLCLARDLRPGLRHKVGWGSRKSVTTALEPRRAIFLQPHI